MIPSNDPVKAWSLMLGLGYGIDKSKYPRTSVDVVCASPQQYQMMMDRYDELFTVSLFLDAHFNRKACTKIKYYSQNWTGGGSQILFPITIPHHVASRATMLKGLSLTKLT